MSTSERLPSLSRAPREAERWVVAGDGWISDSEALELITHGTIDVVGRLPGASNATLYAAVSHDGRTAACVYKPTAGERPLWDFPQATLAEREVASYEVSAAAGFDVVPPTVLREGPFGSGSIQLWVEPEDATDVGAEPGDAVDPPDPGLVDVVDPSAVPDGWLPVFDAWGMDGEPVVLVHAADERLATIATFDVLVNNADRKAGHLLAAPGDRVVGVDHGLTFHTLPKLRTVLWGFAGADLPEPDLARVRLLADALRREDLAPTLARLLAAREIRALERRVSALLEDPRFPLPDPDRHVIPWPPF
ncbi:MAG TPA: SCO1664 family protein [Actinomycetales bacterium]|nr:SCO1664 family protein [Actinomycetales bacterium]